MNTVTIQRADGSTYVTSKIWADQNAKLLTAQGQHVIKTMAAEIVEKPTVAAEAAKPTTTKTI